MTIEEIKKEAEAFKPQSNEEIATKILELKNRGIPFLGCMAFIKANQHLSLAEAKDFILTLECRAKEGRDLILTSHLFEQNDWKDGNE